MPPFRTPISRFLVVLAGLFALELAVLAIVPTSRSDWMLENALSPAEVAALALSYRLRSSEGSALRAGVVSNRRAGSAQAMLSEVAVFAQFLLWEGR